MNTFVTASCGTTVFAATGNVNGKRPFTKELISMMGLLWTIIAVLFILWIIGLGVHWAANIVWVLFIVAVALLIINLIAGLFTRRPVT